MEMIATACNDMVINFRHLSFIHSIKTNKYVFTDIETKSKLFLSRSQQEMKKKYIYIIYCFLHI